MTNIVSLESMKNKANLILDKKDYYSISTRFEKRFE